MLMTEPGPLKIEKKKFAFIGFMSLALTCEFAADLYDSDSKMIKLSMLKWCRKRMELK